MRSKSVSFQGPVQSLKVICKGGNPRYGKDDYKNHQIICERVKCPSAYKVWGGAGNPSWGKRMIAGWVTNITVRGVEKPVWRNGKFKSVSSLFNIGINDFVFV